MYLFRLFRRIFQSLQVKLQLISVMYCCLLVHVVYTIEGSLEVNLLFP